MFGLIHEAGGLPPGVVNLVNGSVDVVNGLLDYAGVDAISFVGSAKGGEVCLRAGRGPTGKRVRRWAAPRTSWS